MSDDKIDVKICSKEEAAWTGIKERAEKEIEESQRVIQIDEKIIELAKARIKAEKQKV